MPAAAVPHAGNMADEDLVGSQLMPTRAVGRRQGEPLAPAVDDVPDAHLVVPPLRHDADGSPGPRHQQPARFPCVVKFSAKEPLRPIDQRLRILQGEPMRQLPARFTACVTAVLTGAGVALAAPAHADERSYIRKLEEAGVLLSISPNMALSMGQWYCQQLRNGRSTQAAYSDLLDYNTQQPMVNSYDLGTVIGAAVFQLCREYGANWNGMNDLDYIPVSQR